VLGLDALQNRQALRQRVGIQLQASELPDKLRVGEALELFASFYADPADPDRLLRLLGLEAKRDDRFANLSGGQRQRRAGGAGRDRSRSTSQCSWSPRCCGQPWGPPDRGSVWGQRLPATARLVHTRHVVSAR
jgi:hypothetical protein